MREILAITGKPGLYKLVSRGNNMLIVESLLDGKRMPTYARDKIVALSDVSMFTDADDVALSEVLTNAGKKEGLKAVAMDPKKATNAELQAWFDEVLPTGTVTASIRRISANSSNGTISSSMQG